ncbi:Large glycine-rich repeat low complexity protein [Cryptosporidium meleagridis]
MINKEYFPREDKKLGLVVNSLLHLTLENKVDSNSISVTNNLVTSTCTNDQTVVNEFQRMNLIEINDETNNIRSVSAGISCNSLESLIFQLEL